MATILQAGQLVPMHTSYLQLCDGWHVLPHHLIATHHFSSVKLVVEDGEQDHFCRTYLLTAFNGSTVRVEETDHSFIDDALDLCESLLMFRVLENVRLAVATKVN